MLQYRITIPVRTCTFEIVVMLLASLEVIIWDVLYYSVQVQAVYKMSLILTGQLSIAAAYDGFEVRKRSIFDVHFIPVFKEFDFHFSASILLPKGILSCQRQRLVPV